MIYSFDKYLLDTVLGIPLVSEFTAMNMPLTPYWFCILVEYSNGMHIIKNVK